MRVCRVCLSSENAPMLKPIMREDCLVASNLFYLFGIVIFEQDEKVPALICPKCLKDVNIATKLKRVALVADKFFRKLTKPTEELLFAKAKDEISVEFEGESDDIVEELIEYDETVESLEEVQEFHLKADEPYEVVDQNMKPITTIRIGTTEPSPPKQFLGGRLTHQCHCGMAFGSKRRLDNHIRCRHEFIPEHEKFVCGICGRKFKLKEYLDNHKAKNHSDFKTRELHPCSICGQYLSSVTAVRNHEEKHKMDTMTEEQIKKFRCDLCDMRFRLKCYLFNHMNNAHIRQKYICPYCEKGFYKKHEAEDHARQHTQENPFECEFEGCGKSFHRRKNLMVHRRIHTGERPYPCSMCEKTFMHCIDRKRHMMKHTGEKPHSCSVCSKGFTRKSELTAHVRAHYTVMEETDK